ncbi:signal peptidase I [Spirochaeta thermophila DSM 6578]|uniref:Signal peptidase I n=1 Tax=Winmispira thermophila (strain ATCC 700085 / DSM 6578 / Z-1203) TaxID=869211 RepID=G0GE84_WINT7|nr:signal peptidase I [Spirochaeta thermophila]AEJ61437.1 signal peptidase I [Spirochaeta thermophila DSM 6578]
MRERIFASRQERRRQMKILWIKRLLLVAVLFNLLQMCALRTYRLDSEVMAPLYRRGAFLVATPLAYGLDLDWLGVPLPRWREPSRGDVVVAVSPLWDPPEGATGGGIRLLDYVTGGRWIPGPEWRVHYVVLRVVGLPGERIRVRDDVVYVRGADERGWVSEEVLLPGMTRLRGGGEGPPPFDRVIPGLQEEMVLGEGEYFLVGDNRRLVADSRIFGPFERWRIRAMVVWAPIRGGGAE